MAKVGENYLKYTYRIIQYMWAVAAYRAVLDSIDQEINVLMTAYPQYLRVMM